jgi:hypothetical protein
MKPENMKTVTRSATNIDQMGDRKLQSSGMDNDSRIKTTNTKYSGNQHGGKAGGNYGRGPTVGNNGTISGKKGPVYSAVPDFKKHMGPSDSINFGKQERTPGGTRSFAPSATENYKGNFDMINAGRGPTKGNSQ